MLQTGQRVQIQYAGSIENGNTFVNTWINGGPVEVTVGSGSLLPRFDRALRTLSRGERTTVVIPMAEAYGAYDEENVVEVPRAQIPNADELPVGGAIAMSTAFGQVKAKVLEVDEETVTFDCNHELAGHDLTFEIELVRDGKETAIDREKGPRGCGCGCDKLKEQLSGSHDGDCCGHHHE